MQYRAEAAEERVCLLEQIAHDGDERAAEDELDVGAKGIDDCLEERVDLVARARLLQVLVLVYHQQDAPPEPVQEVEEVLQVVEAHRGEPQGPAHAAAEELEIPLERALRAEVLDHVAVEGLRGPGDERGLPDAALPVHEHRRSRIRGELLLELVQFLLAANEHSSS